MRVPSTILAVLAVVTDPAAAQQVPTIDTEDASLGSADVPQDAPFHLLGTLDMRNGDFARGAYDDDGADLDRLPVHVQVGFAWRLGGPPERGTFLVFSSSNGLHAPAATELADPRAWYESNNALALILSPANGFRAGIAYTIKASPNGVSATTHELSLTAALNGDGGLGRLSPSAAVTWRPRGGDGLFTQIGIEPAVPLSDDAREAELRFPVRAGISLAGFYEPGTGDQAYGAAGITYVQAFQSGGAMWQLRAELLALVRDDRLRRLGEGDAEHAALVPQATLALRTAF